MDFTIDTYAELVSAAARRYRFLRFAEYSTEGEVALWRHDIDFSPQRALAMARVEAASGVLATYFVQVSSHYYSVFEPEIAAILRQIVSLGHGIGLHFDAEVCAHQSAPDYDRRIAFEAKVLEEVVETNVVAFTLHNPTTLVEVSLNEPSRAGLENASCSDLRSCLLFAQGRMIACCRTINLACLFRMESLIDVNGHAALVSGIGPASTTAQRLLVMLAAVPTALLTMTFRVGLWWTVQLPVKLGALWGSMRTCALSLTFQHLTSEGIPAV